MYEALLKATQEYQKIAASFGKARARQRCSVCPRQAGPCCMPLCRRIWAGCSAS